MKLIEELRRNLGEAKMLELPIKKNDIDPQDIKDIQKHYSKARVYTDIKTGDYTIHAPAETMKRILIREWEWADEEIADFFPELVENINEAKSYYRLNDKALRLLDTIATEHRSTLKDVLSSTNSGKDYDYQRIERLMKDLFELQSSATKGTK